MPQTVAGLLVQTLADIGVRQVFGVIGDAINPFSEALRVQHRIEWIGVRHEEGAALAAAAQAKLTGRLGVCCGTTGPGANHLVAGLYEASLDHAPVLAITGGMPATLRGIDYVKETSPDLLFRDVTVYTQIITSPKMAAQVFHQAIAKAYGERGVAHINIPEDVFPATVLGPTPSLDTLRPRPEVAPSPEDITAAVCQIEDAETVAVLCGTGCRGSEAELIELSDRLRAPLMHTYRGQDMLPFNDPHWIGGVGLIGGRAGLDAVKGADLLLMLGTRLPLRRVAASGRQRHSDRRARLRAGAPCQDQVGHRGLSRSGHQDAARATQATVRSHVLRQDQQRACELEQDARRESRSSSQQTQASSASGFPRNQRCRGRRRHLRLRLRTGHAVGGQLDAPDRAPADHRHV